MDKTSGGAVTRTVTYYPAGGALRIDGNVYYVLKDRLGSAYATTDASGNVVGEMRYYAFGETRLSTGTMFTDRLYTGQRQIAELGIYHYNARFYSPKLGRFLSADTMMSGFANPQSLNRFSYVANNPVRYTDPTGHMLCAFCDGGGDFPDSSPPADEPEPGDGSGYQPPVTDPKTDPDDDGGGGGGDYCATHPGSCGLPIPTVTPIGTLPSSSTQDSSTQTSSASESEPDWGKIALGVGIVLVGTLAVGVIIAGIVLSGPAAPIIVAELLVSTEVWMSIALVGATAFIDYKGFEMIAEGIQGK